MKVLKDGTDIKFDIRSMFVDKKNSVMRPSYKGIRFGMEAWEKLKSLMKVIEEDIKALKKLPAAEKIEYVKKTAKKAVKSKAKVVAKKVGEKV